MKRVLSTLVLVVFLISSLGGCTTTTTGEKTAAGAGLGALLGAVIGYATTGKASGALIGAAVGAAVGGLAGYVIGKHEEEKYKSEKQVYQENPKFAKKGSKLPATIVALNPYVSDLWPLTRIDPRVLTRIDPLKRLLDSPTVLVG